MKSLREQFAQSVLDVGQEDENLVVMVGDISHGILQPFAKACEGRYFNIGILEPAMVSIAAGLSKVGLTPVCHTIAPFLIERSFEQLKLDFGYQQLSGNFVSVGGAFDYSQLGCSHHCYTDVSLISHLPNSQVFCPASPEEFDVLFKAVYRQETLNYFKLTENPHGVIYDQPIIPGQAITLKEGEHATIVALGPQLKNALKAHAILQSQHDIHCDLLYIHTVKPLDAEAIVASVRKTGRVIVTEELSAQDGLFNLVLKACANNVMASYEQLAIKQFVHGYGSYEDLCATAGLTAESICNAVLRLNQ